MAAWANSIGRDAANGQPFAMAITKAVDNIPMLNDVYGALRFTSAHPKLLSLNIPQIAIQGSQSLMTASSAFVKNPILATKALTKFPVVTTLHAIKSLQGDLPAHVKMTDNYNGRIK